MKITKSQLKQIIKEEFSNIKEGGSAGHYVSNYPSREPGYGLPKDPEASKPPYKEPVFHGFEDPAEEEPRLDPSHLLLSTAL